MIRRRKLAQCIRRCLAQLPDHLADVLLMHGLWAISRDKIAEILKVTGETVGNRYDQARKLIRTCLGHSGFGPEDSIAALD
jgi:DNA-directed RNA polymerase specialized sigma24 family protein